MRPTRLSPRDALVVLALGALAVLLARNAWVSDDAFITLRTVSNALDGYGLRYNVLERVQAYTHPLWMLLLLVTHAITGEPYYGTLLVGAGTTLVGVGWLLRTSHNLGTAALAFAMLVSSKAYIDFATSGLENPLTHLLVLATLASVVRGGRAPADLARTTLLIVFALLNRLDAAVLVGPLGLSHVFAARHRLGRAHALAVGAATLPLFAWEAFSLVYYGALVPNTAFAKLGAGVSRWERLGQGLTYLLHPLSFDRITALAIVSTAPLVVVSRGPLRALLAGATLQLLYVVWVGGDFMAGRFFTPVVFISAVALARLPIRGDLAGGLGGVVFCAGALSAYAPVWSGADYTRHPPRDGIADERGFYHRGAGWLGSKQPIDHAFAQKGRQARAAGRPLVVRATLGYFGYYAGPDVHVVDPLGLAEPLIARLPARFDPHWRVGHYRRADVVGYDPVRGIPPDDPALAELFHRVTSITRGPLLSPARWIDGLDLQLRGPGDLRHRRFTAARNLTGQDTVRVGERGVRLDLPAPQERYAPDLLGMYDDRLVVVFLHQDTVLSVQSTLADDGDDFPLRPVAGPVDSLVLYPGSKRGTQRVDVHNLVPRR